MKTKLKVLFVGVVISVCLLLTALQLVMSTCYQIELPAYDGGIVKKLMCPYNEEAQPYLYGGLFTLIITMQCYLMFI